MTAFAVSIVYLSRFASLCVQIMPCVRCTIAVGDLESEETEHRDQTQSTGTGPVTLLLNVNSPRMRMVSRHR